MLIIQLRIAGRNLLRQKGYSTINIVGLALGLASCMYIFLYIKNELNYDRFHSDAERIYRVVKTVESAENLTQSATTSAPLGPVLRDTFPEIEQVVRIRPPGVSWMLRYGEKSFYEKGFYLADSDIFEVFTFPLVEGDPKTALKNVNSVVVSESVASKYFGDTSPMGMVIRAEDSMDLLVTGVMRDIPSTSHLQFDFLAPFDIQKGWEFNQVDDWGPHLKYYTYLLLSSASDVKELEQKLPDTVDQHVGGMYLSSNLKPHYTLQPITDIHLYSHIDDEISPNSDVLYIYVFLVVAILILSISCINFMNLTTARSADRAKEIGLRKVLGAQRQQLVRQFLGESLLLTGIAVVVAIVFLELAIPIVSQQIDRTFSFTLVDRMGTWGLLVILGGITGIIAGSYPAFYLSSFEPVKVLYGKLSVGIRTGWLRNVLVILQFSISVVLIACAQVVSNQLDYISNRHLGYSKDQVLVVPMTFTPVFQSYPVYKEAILRTPLIKSVGTSTLDLRTSNGVFTNIFRVPGHETATMNMITSDASFRQTLGIDLVAGSFFSEDNMSHRNACVINEAVMHELGWTPATAIGQYIEWLVPQEWLPDGVERRREVIGVVRDFHFKSLHSPIEPLVFLYESAGFYVYVHVDADRMPEAITHLEDTWNRINPNFAFEYHFLDAGISDQYRLDQKLSYLIRLFSIIAIVIACLGLLGLSSFAIQKRAKEVCVRKVLGASMPQLLNVLTRDVLWLILIANLIAWPIAYVLTNNWIHNFAFRYTDSVPFTTLIFVGMFSIFISALAVGFQTLKATMANPADTLSNQQ